MGASEQKIPPIHPPMSALIPVPRCTLIMTGRSPQRASQNSLAVPSPYSPSTTYRPLHSTSPGASGGGPWRSASPASASWLAADGCGLLPAARERYVNPSQSHGLIENVFGAVKTTFIFLMHNAWMMDTGTAFCWGWMGERAVPTLWWRHCHRREGHAASSPSYTRRTPPQHPMRAALPSHAASGRGTLGRQDAMEEQRRRLSAPAGITGRC